MKIKNIFIDLDKLEKYKEGKYEGKINWKNNIGKKVSFIYEDIEGKLEIVDYDSKTQYLTIKYNNNIKKILTGHFCKGKLGSVINKINKEHIYKEGEIIKDEKRNIILTKKIKTSNNRKGYIYTCLNCGWNEGVIEEYDIKRGYGCSCCSGHTTVKGINDIATTRPDLIKYFKNKEDSYKYCMNSNKKLYFICPQCGREKQMMIGTLAKYGFSCNNCGDGFSYPSKFIMELIRQLLEQKQIKEYKSEKSFAWSNGKRYDLYIVLNNKNTLLIEINGEQHYGYNNINYMAYKGGRTLKEEQRNDAEKCWLAYKNGIDNYVQLDCRESSMEFIKNSILNSELLNILFNLNNINWNLCNLKGNVNIKNEVNKYWDNKEENETTLNVANKFGLDRSTVINYLKDNSNYNPKEENKKSALRNNKLRRKTVLAYTLENEFLGEFESAYELSNNSLQILGVSISATGISKSCRLNGKPIKGFIFKYKEEK